MSDLSKVKYINVRKITMTKTQIKSLSDTITQTNGNEKTRNTFTVECGNAYFTPDGYIGYEIPMEIIYQAEEAHGITIPEASKSTTESNKFSETSWKDYQRTSLNAKEFLAELKALYKEVKKTLLTPETAVYKIKFNDKIHGYRIGLMINMLAEELTKDNDVLHVAIHRWILKDDGTQEHAEDDCINGVFRSSIPFNYTNKNHREMEE